MGKPFIRAIRARAAFAAFLVALSGAAPRFSYSQAPESAKYSNSLIAVAGATNTSYAILSEGRQQLSYVTESDYPATKILSFISNDLRKKGWNTLDQDFMNPGFPRLTSEAGRFRERESKGPHLWYTNSQPTGKTRNTT